MFILLLNQKTAYDVRVGDWSSDVCSSYLTKGSRSTPGRAATLTVVTTVMLYLLATTGSIGFAGLGTGEFGLGNPDVQRNAFLALAAPVLGSFALLISVRSEEHTSELQSLMRISYAVF